VYGYVYTFLAGARKLANFTPITKRSRTVGGETVVTHSPPAEQYKEAARGCAYYGMLRRALRRKD
jgi:hypothetical protein